MAVYTRIRTALARRAELARTTRELRSLPLDVALDLDIDRSQASRIAYRSVYGA